MTALPAIDETSQATADGQGLPAPVCSAFWKCAACPFGECYVKAAKKPRQCVAGMPIQPLWRATTEENYNAATVVINFDSPSGGGEAAP
jgi:hypothetical protein